MIVYKLDKPAQVTANAQIRDMGTVLSEIATTLRILRGLLNEHQNSLVASTHINKYREDLLNMTAEAIRLTHLIAVNSQRLSTVSDQTAKQLTILDEQIAAALQGRNGTDEAAADQTTKTSAANSDQAANRTLSFSKLSRV